MKRSWFSLVVVGAVFALLTLFLGLQYRWLSEASEAEGDRMRKRVEIETSRFAEDFNREMQAAYYNFQTGAELWKTTSWDDFNERYDFWQQRTAYPELIREIHFLPNEGEFRPLKYDVAKRSFESEEPTPDLQRLRETVVNSKEPRPTYDDQYTLVLPIHEGEARIDHIVFRRSPERSLPRMMEPPKKFGWLVIRLDEDTIKNRILPDLTAKYFPEKDYSVSVIDKDEQAIFGTQNPETNPDATAKMFSLSPDNLLFFANKEALPKMAEETNRSGIVVNQSVETHSSFTRTQRVNGKTETFNIDLQQPGEKGKLRTASVIATAGGDGGPWTLRAQHTSGSIAAFIKSERNKSLLISLGIYVLLLAGIAAILISALRSRRFAQRQVDFVSSVSHEFRTPLAVIYSAGENLADGVATEDAQVSRYGELIKGEGKKLSGMVEQILEFAGANSGKRKYNFSETAVSDVVREAIDECRSLIDSGGFTVETDIREGLPTISADRLALTAAIQNLIANSVKFSNGSKWIKISAANGEKAVKISVEDHGIGISGSDLRMIFEPFYRSKEVVDAQISGNGLGLNLVKKIAEAHGGRVSAESKPGQGSKFTIELPQNL